MKYLMTFALTVALAACGSKKDKEAPPPPPPATGSGSAMMGSGATAMGSGSAAGSAAPAAVDVPTEEDFETQAKTDITDKNVDTQVKKIEGELGSGQ